MSQPTEIENPNPDAEQALEEPGPDGLTAEQFAARLSVKREAAAQDAGWVVPPGHPDDPDVEPIEGSEYETPAEEPEEETPEESEVEGELTDEQRSEVDDELTDEEQAAVDEMTPEEQEAFYVGRYKTREEAEEGLREKDLMIDRLFREMEDRRTEREKTPEQAQPQPLDTEAWHEWASSEVDRGSGINGAVTALQSGGPQGYDIYLTHWMASEDLNERAQAVSFNNEVQRILAEQRALSAVSPLIDERRRLQGTEEAEQARIEVATRFPDFDDLQEDMDKLANEDGALPQDTKAWLTQMASSGLEGKQRAWEYLYLAARAQREPRRARAASQEQKRRRSSADAAKIAATVSTSEGTATRTPASPAEREAFRRKQELRKATGLPLLDEE
jgi:hypothetical protein